MTITLRNLLLLGTIIAGSVYSADASAQSFTPGATWKDKSGTHINAHGGCVVYTDGYYYWFGENRNKNASNGVSCYKSSDLYNWTRVGLAVTPSGTRDDDTYQDISSGRTLERPKVIYNKTTGKWVMWIHWENGDDYGRARVAVLTADKVEGPYSLVSTFRPNGHDSRDQTLLLTEDGTAYHFCSTNMNTDINVVRLSDDFLTPTEDEVYIMKGQRVEATTAVQVDETFFCTFSECDGWNPAPGHTATTVGDVLGTWTEGETFCVDANAATSYKSQGAYCFSVKDLGYDRKCFIYFGDRWNSSNIQSSTYVWLPMSVRSGYPTVRFLDSWTLKDEMTDMYRYKRAASIVPGNTYSLLERNSNRLMSKTQTNGGFCIKDDDDNTNMKFVFEATDDPYVWKLRDASTDKYMVSIFGSLRLDSDGSSKCAEWKLLLQSDGYYYVVNNNDGTYLSVSGSSKFDGTDLFLNEYKKSIPQSFAVYFDSKNQDYEEADMYKKAYFDKVAEDMKKQEEALAVRGLESDASDVAVSVSADSKSLNVTLPVGVESADVTISTVGGAVVAQASLTGNGAHSVDVSAAVGGVYVARIACGGSTAVAKILLR